MKNKPFQIVILPRNPRRAGGFTLVELLVTITIILVLAALTMTVTQKIRASAYRANAMSSLRQVAAFSTVYATENNGDINTMRFLDKYEGKPNWVKNTFWGRLQPYMFPDATGSDAVLKNQIEQRLARVFNTSDVKTMANTALKGARIYGDTKSGIPTPLAFNVNLVQWDKFVKVSSFDDPSQILYATYGTYMFDEADGKVYAPMAMKGQAVVSNIYYLDDKKTIAAFLDGHIESLSAPIPSRRFK